MLIVVGSQLTPLYRYRYLFIVLPALPLLAGLSLASLRPLVAWPLFALLLAASLAALASDYRGQAYQEWRSAVRTATDSARPGDGWLIVGGRALLPFEYYANWRWGQNPNAPYADLVLFDDTAQSFQRFRLDGQPEPADPHSFLADHARIWLVTRTNPALPSPGPPDADPYRLLSARGYRGQTARFSGGWLLLFERSN
jgi:hypothetical protein